MSPYLALKIPTNVSVPATDWPLSVASSGRYLQKPDGTPYLIHGDTPWTIAVSLTHAEIDTYLNNRAAKQMTAILFNSIENFFGGQTPPYRNQAGHDPFTTMSPVDWASPNESYWQTVDHIVDGCRSRGIWCIINPAYISSGQGWGNELDAASDAELEAHGEFLATRYGSDNVGWSMGGDTVSTSGTRAKQNNIATGITNIDPGALITAHGGRTQVAFNTWGSEPWYNLNNIYVDQVEYVLAATEYARSPVIPFFLIEGRYEGESNGTEELWRRHPWGSYLSGACGHLYGHGDVWEFDAGWQASLDDTVATQLIHFKTLLDSYAWQTLVPDDSLVTSSQGSGGSRIIPGVASDGSFAMIFNPNATSATIDMTKLTPSSVRARFYDPTNGNFTTAAGSPWPNTGTQTPTWPGERILVMDAN